MRHQQFFNQSNFIIIDQNSDESSVRVIFKRINARITSLVDRNTIINEVEQLFDHDASDENDIFFDVEKDVVKTHHIEWCVCKEFSFNFWTKIKFIKTVTEIKTIDLLSRVTVFLNAENSKLCFNYFKFLTSKLSLQTREKFRKKLLNMLFYLKVNKHHIENVKISDSHHMWFHLNNHSTHFKDALKIYHFSITQVLNFFQHDVKLIWKNMNNITDINVNSNVLKI